MSYDKTYYDLRIKEIRDESQLLNNRTLAKIVNLVQEFIQDTQRMQQKLQEIAQKEQEAMKKEEPKVEEVKEEVKI